MLCHCILIHMAVQSADPPDRARARVHQDRLPGPSLCTLAVHACSRPSGWAGELACPRWSVAGRALGSRAPARPAPASVHHAPSVLDHGPRRRQRPAASCRADAEQRDASFHVSGSGRATHLGGRLGSRGPCSTRATAAALAASALGEGKRGGHRWSCSLPAVCRAPRRQCTKAVKRWAGGRWRAPVPPAGYRLGAAAAPTGLRREGLLTPVERGAGTCTSQPPDAIVRWAHICEQCLSTGVMKQSFATPRVGLMFIQWFTIGVSERCKTGACDGPKQPPPLRLGRDGTLRSALHQDRWVDNKGNYCASRVASRPIHPAMGAVPECHPAGP